MQSLDHSAADLALQTAFNMSTARKNQVLPYENESDSSSDDVESSSPIFDTFYKRNGSAAIFSMKNYSAPEFMESWTIFGDYITKNWNTGRAKRSSFCPKDVLFMTFSVMKHGGDWSFLGDMFRIKGPTFEKLIDGFLNVLSDECYSVFVEEANAEWSMKKLTDNGTVFLHNSRARYATDVTFQQSNSPGGNPKEGKAYFSGKHKLYGFKVEVSVLPNGLAVMCSNHFPGSTSDIDILYSMKEKHFAALHKRPADVDICDVAPLHTLYPTSWLILADEGYQGSQSRTRVLHPKKKPPRGSLKPVEEVTNKDISSDRILIENYFGRVCTRWNVLSAKYRWGERRCDKICRFCVAMTNFHIEHHPLRARENVTWCAYRRRAVSIGRSSGEKRRRDQEAYRERRLDRLSTGHALADIKNCQE